MLFWLFCVLYLKPANTTISCTSVLDHCLDVSTVAVTPRVCGTMSPFNLESLFTFVFKLIKQSRRYCQKLSGSPGLVVLLAEPQAHHEYNDVIICIISLISDKQLLFFSFFFFFIKH
ncbi:hypothetical protein M405DRAFT_225635 [Rhizopogon salebrosus TDB-379]|nr:hypothetical protein M405DRAFT_225635 [Rhizopogon salebrosus TDB-379]